MTCIKRVSFTYFFPFYHYYRPQRSCGQGNVFTGVRLSTGGEGVCLSACWDARPPPPDQADPPGPGRPPRIRQTPPSPDQADPPWIRQTPPGSGRPPRTRQTTPRTRQTPPGSRLQHTVYERPVRILLECILVIFETFTIIIFETFTTLNITQHWGWKHEEKGAK